MCVVVDLLVDLLAASALVAWVDLGVGRDSGTDGLAVSGRLRVVALVDLGKTLSDGPGGLCRGGGGRSVELERTSIKDPSHPQARVPKAAGRGRRNGEEGMRRILRAEVTATPSPVTDERETGTWV